MSDAAVSPIQVFVVASAMLSWGLEKLFQAAAPRIALAGSATTLAQAEPALRGDTVDVLVLDVDGGYGTAVIDGLVQHPRTRVVLLTSSAEPALLDQAIVAGARGVVRKNDSPNSLLKAVERVHAGELWIDRVATGRIFVELARRGAARENDPEEARIASLTARERQMIMALASDTAVPGKVIASRLFISEHTLRNHLSTIYAKLGLANRLDLFAYASRHRLDKPR